MLRRGKAPGDGAIAWMWPGQRIEELGRLIIAGRKPHRWPIPGAHRCVVEAFDIDRDAGLAAVVITTLPFRGPAATHQEVYEHDAEHGWVAAGGGSVSPADRARVSTRPSVARSGPAVLINAGSGSGGRSYLERLRLREAGHERVNPGTINWTCSCEINVAVEVDHILFAGRRIEVPAHGRCVAVWKSPALTPSTRPVRPHIAAADRNGRILTELGAYDALDTFTQAVLDELT
jgi:hypothetical protein